AAVVARNGIEHQLVVKAAANDHGAPVEEGLGGGGAAPHQYAIPLEALFVRIEPPAHGRMNAVAANENVAGACRARAVRVLEAGFDAVFLLGKGDKGVITTDRGAAKSLPYRIAQQALQMPAVNGELRHLVASLHSARLAPNLLAEAIGVNQLARPDCHFVEPGQQSQLAQLGNGVRQHIDADPKLANSGRRLVDLTVDAAGLEHEGKRKSADPSANDEDAHDYSPLSRAQAGRPSSIVGRAVRQKYSARP